MASLLFYGGAIGSGLVLGWLFVRLWRLCAPRETNRRFWASLGDVTRQMLTVDEVSRLLSLYRRLARDVGGYLLRNLGGVVLACLPVAAFLILVAPAALALWDRGAERVALYPPLAAAAQQRGDLSLAALGIMEGKGGGRTTGAVGRTAVCWTETDCTIFRLLAFRVIETAEPALPAVPYLVVRAQRGDRSVLWPYLGDLELAFACAFMAATIGGLFWRRTAG